MLHVKHVMIWKGMQQVSTAQKNIYSFFNDSLQILALCVTCRCVREAAQLPKQMHLHQRWVVVDKVKANGYQQLVSSYYYSIPLFFSSGFVVYILLLDLFFLVD
jgi:hypothetical protein